MSSDLEMISRAVACCSVSQYVDDLIGSIVDEVKALRLYEDTTIVFWSDHVGAATPNRWHLGCILL